MASHSNGWGVGFHALCNRSVIEFKYLSKPQKLTVLQTERHERLDDLLVFLMQHNDLVRRRR